MANYAPIMVPPGIAKLLDLRPLERFVVKDKKRIFFVPVSHVLWIEATGNYACIHTASNSHLLRETLAHLEEKLAPHHFIRVRKSAIVNSARISEIRPMFDGVYDIITGRRNGGHVESQICSQVTSPAGILVLAPGMKVARRRGMPAAKMNSVLASIPIWRAWAFCLQSWACGAAGSALPWHGRGRRFDPHCLWQLSLCFQSVTELMKGIKGAVRPLRTQSRGIQLFGKRHPEVLYKGM